MFTLQKMFLSSLLLLSAALHCADSDQEKCAAEKLYEASIQRRIESAQLKFTDPRFDKMFVDKSPSAASAVQQLLAKVSTDPEFLDNPALKIKHSKSR